MVCFLKPPSPRAWKPLWAVVCCLLAACFQTFSRSENNPVTAVAAQHGLERLTLAAGGFQITGFKKPVPFAGDSGVIYIEGDGFAWVHRGLLSSDPTPYNPLVLRLMLADPAPNVIYLGRPCHFVGGSAGGCPARYWSSHRYAPEVVQAMGSAIDVIKQRYGLKRVGLVGYSGGGAVAALLAAHRSDVAWIITIAANLDLETWIAHHQVTPMPDSLNPADFAQQLQSINQYHFVGGNDDQVPEKVVHSYRERFPGTPPITITVIPQFDHTCCWPEQWPALLQRIPFKRF